MKDFKKGDMVVVRNGAQVKYRGKIKTLKRSQVIKIDHVSNYVQPFTVVWPGSGGYWAEASYDDCEYYFGVNMRP